MFSLHKVMLLRSVSKQFRYASTSIADRNHVIYRKYPPIVLIGINNPDNRNAINENIATDLANAITEFENDATAKVGILFGEGGNFCSGYDLKELAKYSDNPPQHFLNNNLTEKFVHKPLIAAVNGYAVGVGFDLALMCDIRIMETSAIFGYYGRRFGMTASKCGLERLSAMLGFSKTMDLILTGRAVKSEEAFNTGLANRVVECGTVIGHALNLANDISKFPQAAIYTDRAALYKFNFAHTFKFENMDEIFTRYEKEVLEDIKKGAKLFSDGAGKRGSLFSKFLWDKD